MENKKKYKIFLSYASEQHNIAEQIYITLLNSCHEVFFDRTSLLPGKDYNPSILKEIRSSDLFIFLISPQSVEDGAYARTELKFAADVWRSPQGHVLPVMAIETPLETVPNYLKATTFLSAHGNLPAEVSAAVDDISTGWTHDSTVLGQATVVKQLQMDQELADIDKEWENQKNELFFKTQDGRYTEPTRDILLKTNALLGFITLVFIIVVAANIENLGGAAIPAIIIPISVWYLVYRLNKNKINIYENAHNKYIDRRSSVVNEYSDTLEAKTPSKQNQDTEGMSAEDCVSALIAKGYGAVEKSSREWIIKEPFGGWAHVNSLRELQEYTNGRI